MALCCGDKFWDTMAAPVIIILGPPGSGKGTQSEILAKRLGAVHFSSGEILRKSGDAKILSQLSTGKLATADDFRKAIRFALAGIDVKQVIILDGVGRKEGEVKWLGQQLMKMDRPIKKVIHLMIAQTESLKRSLPRKRLEDLPEVQYKRWQEYERHMLKTMMYYLQAGLLVEVDGNGTREEVSARIQKVLG